MRNIKDYEEKYKQMPYEQYQAKYRRKKILELMNERKPANVLEIGCALEPLFKYYSDFEKMVVVEPAEYFFEQARLQAEKKQKDIICIQSFFEESVETLKKLEIEFDYIVLSGLLHEVEYPKQFLEAVRQVCGKKTVIHINVPNANSIHRLLAKEMNLIEDVHELSEQQKMMQQNRVYDMDSLSSIVQECGFQIEEKGSLFLKFLTAKQMQRMLEEGIVGEEISEGMDRMIKYFPEYGSEIYVQAKIL